MSVSSTAQRDRGRNRHHVQVMRPPQPMCRSNSRSPPPPITTTKTTSNSVVYAQQQLGVSLSEGLEKAYSECKAKVERIAAQCRLKNRKFRYNLTFVLFFFCHTLALNLLKTFLSHRDVEFDLENDASRCLHNLTENNLFVTSDVRRVPDIFKDPVFFSGTPKSAEIVQGAVEDCYLVSALSTMTSIERLISNLCVAVSTPCLINIF